jgi:FlaA1/EpsC-like NDP-sugar epimerase
MSESIVPAKDTIHDSVVTITGGTGSCGSTMAILATAYKTPNPALDNT